MFQLFLAANFVKALLQAHDQYFLHQDCRGIVIKVVFVTFSAVKITFIIVLSRFAIDNSITSVAVVELIVKAVLEVRIFKCLTNLIIMKLFLTIMTVHYAALLNPKPQLGKIS